jgi:hypothetical protein
MHRAAAFAVLLLSSMAIAAWLTGRHVPGAPASASQAQAFSPRPSVAPARSAGAADALGTQPPPPEAHPLSEALCAADMVLVRAERCPSLRQTCENWRDSARRSLRPEGGDRKRDRSVRPEGGDRKRDQSVRPEGGDRKRDRHCARYAAASTDCRGQPEPMAFCIDRYEYPNLEQALPAAAVTFEQAEQACSAEGKRLCTEKEWTLACEGTERTPYLTGFELAQDVCNVSAAHPPAGQSARRAATANESGRLPVSDHAVSAAFAALDRRTPSGAFERCVSAFGAYDLSGNVAEWVRAEGTGHFRAGLKGGDFGGPPVPCRAVKKTAVAHLRSYGTGFRCCGDPLVPLRRRPGRGYVGAKKNE